MIGLSLGAFGLFHAGAQAFLTGPAVARLGERWALVVGMACELTALVVLGFATQGWILFALAPLFALGGIGMPALQSLTTQQVDADNQGKLQGVLASLVSLAVDFRPAVLQLHVFRRQAGLAGADLDRRRADLPVGATADAGHPHGPAAAKPDREAGKSRNAKPDLGQIFRSINRICTVSTCEKPGNPCVSA